MSTLTSTIPPAADLEARVPRRQVNRAQTLAYGTLLALVLVAAVSLVNIGGTMPPLAKSWVKTQHFLARVGHITLPSIPDALYQSSLTLSIVILGTVFAALVSVPVAYLAAANTTPGPIARFIGRFIGVFTRALPDAVLAMIFVLMFSLGTLPGILAIGIHSIGMISKLFADAIEQIDEGPRLAIRAAGGSRGQEFMSGILPQVFPAWIAIVLHRNDINLRGSVVLGYVGVAGLGMQMSLAFSALNYSVGLGYAVVIFALCVVMELISSNIRKRMLGGKSSSRSGKVWQPAGVTEAARQPWTSSRVSNLAWVWGGLAVVVAATFIAQIHWSDVFTVWGYIPPVAAKLWPPAFGYYPPPTIFGAMGMTIVIALAATLLSFGVSLFIGSLAARNVAPNAGVRNSMRVLLVIVRGVPELILAIILIVITGLGPQAGMLALAFGGVGLLGKLIADSFEEVSYGPEEALRTTGASRLQVYGAATLPQGVPALIGHSFYLLDTNIRAATILGIVGGGGVGYYLLNAAQGSNYQLITSIVLMMIAAVLMVEGLAMWMRKVFR